MPPPESPRSDVSITKVKGGYPRRFPFSPDQKYPEYIGAETSTEANPVYSAVRDNLYRLGLDRENFGTRHWNPLATIIKPGDRVFI